MLNIKLFDGQITENFNIVEFKCKANGEVLLNGDVIDHIQRLQKFRTWYNRIIVPISGYRTREYNEKIGGAENSYHIKGVATDVPLPEEYLKATDARQKEYLNNVKNKWIELCKADGISGGIGLYDRSFHLDSRKGEGQTIIWDRRSKK